MIWVNAKVFEAMEDDLKRLRDQARLETAVVRIMEPELERLRDTVKKQEDLIERARARRAVEGKTFEEAWARMEALGYQYGEDALEQVRLGWDLRETTAANERNAVRRPSKLAAFMERLSKAEEESG